MTIKKRIRAERIRSILAEIDEFVDLSERIFLIQMIPMSIYG